MRVRVYLRQALFSFPGDAAHVPPHAAVVEGASSDVTASGARVLVETYYDEKGRTLEGLPCEILIPAAKIDHVLFLS